ncbi:MAG: ATP-binding protein [Candidatus Eremiobacteraeota bacterium]|nr:ATP-binding protein [Candidatus Eremiobacteraeota bacterium]
MLIVFTGLPGTGKTTLATQLAARLGCAIAEIDAIGSALRRAGATPDPIGLADYVIAETIADATLRAGATIIIDAVNGVEPARAMWRDLAERHGTPLRIIEIVCADAAEHRHRVEQRNRNLAHRDEPTWSDVQTREYEPWHDDRLVLDSRDTLAACLSRAESYVTAAAR